MPAGTVAVMAPMVTGVLEVEARAGPLNCSTAWPGVDEPSKEKRAPVKADNSLVKVEKTASSAISASLDYYRAMRDAMSEAAFFTTYGNVFSLYVADKPASHADARAMFDEQIGWAVEAGVDLIIGETYSHGGEALLAVERMKRSGLPDKLGWTVV